MIPNSTLFFYHQNANSKIRKFCISRESVDSILGNAKLLCAPSDRANIYPPSICPTTTAVTLLIFLGPISPTGHPAFLSTPDTLICEATESHMQVKLTVTLHKALRNKGSINLAITTFFNFVSTLQFIIYNFFSPLHYFIFPFSYLHNWHLFLNKSRYWILTIFPVALTEIINHTFFSGINTT